ncbi:hypothetical protein [Mycobacteroides abscessus]|uniref:hypothetical protein n=1 Tax=Mycobacteroides abscessus TaxID=36809 RepID=UPI00092CE201|nr:hypothetical protein [Mycobacteroides abscessus]SIF35349.1 Uncharacterised protein [Mycobacteroides abscessus subsp. abscessus]
MNRNIRTSDMDTHFAEIKRLSESYAHDPDCGYIYRDDSAGEHRCIGSDESEQERDK